MAAGGLTPWDREVLRARLAFEQRKDLFALNLEKDERGMYRERRTWDKWALFWQGWLAAIESKK